MYTTQHYFLYFLLFKINGKEINENKISLWNKLIQGSERSL